MIGAIPGDIIGSIYEHNNIKQTDFPLFSNCSSFTDDTVMTLAVAEWLLCDENHTTDKLVKCMQTLGCRHFHRGYGRKFKEWLLSDNPQPYRSYGNGSAMRVSPVALYASSIEEALDLAKITAEVTHNHPEGIKGAQAIAACIFMAKSGKTKEEIKEYIEQTFNYDLNESINEIRKYYTFTSSCQGSVPQSIGAYLEGETFENVVRLAISIGGDSDTIGSMAGAIAAITPGYVISEEISSYCYNLLTGDLQAILDKFEKEYLSVK